MKYIRDFQIADYIQRNKLAVADALRRNPMYTENQKIQKLHYKKLVHMYFLFFSPTQHEKNH